MSETRTAIIITGQLRSIETIFQSIVEHLVTPNNGVLFFACEVDDPSRLKALLNKYPDANVGGILCEKTFRNLEFNSILQMIKNSNRAGLSEEVFQRSRKADGINWQYSYVESSGTILQYYQFWKVWHLVLEYERKNSMKFSHCVRTRTDITISRPIDVTNVFSNIDINTLKLESIYFRTPKLEYDLENTVITLGHEQVWIAKRSVFDRLSMIVFHYGYWDSGLTCAFNSEFTFDQFCKHFNIYHIGIEEKGWGLYSYSHADSKKWLISVCRF
jgi:hypothetical protein